MYSQCIRILVPFIQCHESSFEWWFRPCRAGIFFHALLSLFFILSVSLALPPIDVILLCRFSFFSHLSYHTSHTSALRWIFEHFNAALVVSILMHVHNVIILHNVLCSVTVRCCAYFSLTLLLHKSCIVAVSLLRSPRFFFLSLSSFSVCCILLLYHRLPLSFALALVHFFFFFFLHFLPLNLFASILLFLLIISTCFTYS